MHPLAPRLLAFLILLPAAAPLTANDGTLDMSFGGGDGVASWPATGTNTATLAAIASTDELLIGVGSYEIAGDPPTHLAWQAVDINGELRNDHRCGQATSTLIPLTVSSAATAGLIDGSGNLVVAGHAEFIGSETQQVPFIARFDLSTPGCVLDAAFSANGYDVLDDLSACQSASCSFVALAELGPGTLAVPLSTYRTIGLLRAATGFLTARYFLVSIKPDGSVDTSFGTSGFAEVIHSSLGDLLGGATSIAVDGRGRIYVVVSELDPHSSTTDLDTYLLRYQSDGDLDTICPPFLPCTPFVIPLEDGGDDDGVNSLAGEVVVAQNGDPIASWEDVTNSHENQTTLNFAANATYRRVSAGASGVWRMVVQGNDEVLAGTDNAGFDGLWTKRQRTVYVPPSALPLDATWGPGDGSAFSDVDLGGSNSETLTRVALWHGRLVLGGFASSASGNRAWLQVLDNSYVFADSFDQGTWAAWSSAKP